jgi:hypothetical protein
MATGSGGTAPEPEASARSPAYGILATGDAEDPRTLVRLEPRTLRPVGGRSVRLDPGLGAASRSPDGRFVAFLDYGRPLVRAVDLVEMRVRGDVRVAMGSRWRARAAAWLTADRLAVVVQRMRGAHDQIVDRREVVLVDPLARRVIARRTVAGATALRASAYGGDKLVLVLGRADRRHRSVRIVAIDSVGKVRSQTVDGGGDSLVVEPSGRRAFLVSAGASVVEIDLETMQLSSHPVAGGGAVFAPRGSFATRHGVWVGRETVAVTGHNLDEVGGVERSRPAGLALVDVRTWKARLIDPAASEVTFSAGTLIASSVRGPRPGRSGPTLVGIGLRAYGVDGTLRWRRFAGQPLIAQAFRNVALVYRNVPARPSAPFVVGLGSGRRIGTAGKPGQNFWVLADAPSVSPTRRPSSAQPNTSALEVEGDGEAFTATARDDVTQVVAALVDGTQREISLEGRGLSYEAATPDQSARLLQAYAGERLVASVELPVSCGGSAGPCAAAARPSEPTYAFIGELPTGGTSLVRVDPRTLEPVGSGLSLEEPFHPSYARSPDGKRVALAVRERPVVRIVDLERLEVVQTLRLGAAGSEARALAWLDDDRLVAVVQRMSRPTRRYVRERAVVTLEPSSGRTVTRRQVTNKLAVGGVGVGAGRLVVLLRPSGPDGSAVELVVANADGSVWTRAIDVGRRGGVLNAVGLAVDPNGRRAFLVGWAIRRRTPPVTEVDLETMAVTVRRLRVEPTGPLPPAALSSLWVGAVDGRRVAAIGAIASKQRVLPAAGVFLIDTRSWTARLADARATYFQASDGKLVTYGPSSRGQDLHRRAGRGSGLSAYDSNGRRLYHLYANRPFSQVALAGDFGHVLLAPPRTKRLVFDARGGRPLGMLPALKRPIEILQPPPRAPGTRTTSSVRGSRQSDPFARVSNRGTRVQPKAEKRGEREHVPRDVFLLRRAEGRAVYRIGGVRPGYDACYASGFANEIGRIGSLSCGRAGFPSRRSPVFVMSAVQLRPRDRKPQLLRLEGVAADGVAEIGLLGGGGIVVARLPVEANVFILAKPPAEATGGIVAFDDAGRVVYRTAPSGRPPRLRPSRPAEPRRLAGYRIELTLPKGWTGNIRRSGAGPSRALVRATNSAPPASDRWASLVLAERDPRSRPSFPRVAAPPRLASRDVSLTAGGRARASRRFSYKGRQFTLDVDFGTRRPGVALVGQVNRVLATLEVGAIAVAQTSLPTGAPLQRGRADGVSVDVHRGGIVVLRFDTTTALYRRLRGKPVGLSCLTFDSVAPWEENGSGASRPLAETIRFAINEMREPRLPFATLDPQTAAIAPFDGCQVSGSYGRRWNDPRGQHSPVEVAFTVHGARYFDERAVARDLASFAHSPLMRSVRRALKRGGTAPAAEAITRRLPARVVALADRRRVPATGQIGVWTDRREIIEVSARSTRGKRLFIVLRSGRIHRHNLEGLAFVF